VLQDYLGFLAEELQLAPDSLCRPIPGASNLVEHLAGDGWQIGLGTGNVREGARLKLQRVALWDRFTFGGYGCDDEDRGALLRIAATRGASSLGVAAQDCTIAVVGDTPRDIAAAHAIGSPCLAVATGQWDCEALLAAGADCAVSSLDDTEAYRFLTGLV
jgi:phosphoglycolate phosphatase